MLGLALAGMRGKKEVTHSLIDVLVYLEIYLSILSTCLRISSWIYLSTDV